MVGEIDPCRSTFKKNKVQVEVDVLVVAHNAVYLVEVKSNPNKVKSFEQLKKAEGIVRPLMKAVGIGEKIPILKIIATPKMPVRTILEIARTTGTIVLAFNEGESTPKESLEKALALITSAPEINDESYSLLLASLMFMKCCSFNIAPEPRVIVKEKDLEESQREGCKALKIKKMLLSQSPLAKWKNEKVRKKVFGKFVVWLDPVQVAILDDETKRQIIIGNAATGKTLVIQLKVLELLHDSDDHKILIILPYSKLVQFYDSFFEAQGIKKDSTRYQVHQHL